MMKNIWFIIALAVVAAACSGEYPAVDTRTNITGLAVPASLAPGTTEIVLSDFITGGANIEKLSIKNLPDSLYHVEGNILYVEPLPGMPAIVPLMITADGVTEAVPLMRSARQAVELKFDPMGEHYERVSARGEFNGWTPGRPEFEFRDGIWSTTLMLDPGTYQYLLVLDGKDMLDPENPVKIDNNQGGFNSVLSVGMDIADRVPRIFTHAFEDDDVCIGSQGEVGGIMVLWQNILLPGAYLEAEGEGKYEIGIPEASRKMPRSFLRVWAWNEYGVSNDLLIPLEYGSVLRDPDKLNRHDLHGMIMYNAFVDRFFDADSSNNRPLDIPEVLPQADYHGGDIKGVTARIRDGYFEELGVNTIWISPVVKNPESAFGYWPEPESRFSGYHGYWPVSFTLVDDRYGTGEDLHELVKVAHEHNMNVLLDFVANHVHKEHPVYIANPDWATELYLPDGSLNTERWDEYRLTTWFDVFLPTLDLSKPEVYEMLSDSAVYWIKTYELDGFRHDATKHIPEVFWRTLTRKLKEEVMSERGTYVYQIGETYGGPELISSYVGSGMLDAQFDFNVYDDALAVLIRPNEPFTRLDASLKESLRFYGSHNLMGYITGNQDRGRFISYAGGDLLFDEDAKKAGWTRTIGVGDQKAYDIAALLFAFNMTIPGLPVIYYGDEIGMPGGNDPDSRRMMRFNNLAEEEKELKGTVQKLTSLRRNNLALIYGDFITLLASEQTYAYCRTYFDEIVIVVMNKVREPREISFELPGRFAGIAPESQFGTSAVIDGRTLSLSLDPLSFDIFTAKR